MNWRCFPVEHSSLLLRCGISIWLMTAMGQNR